jgi:hypothetical protein
VIELISRQGAKDAKEDRKENYPALFSPLRSSLASIAALGET